MWHLQVPVHTEARTFPLTLETNIYRSDADADVLADYVLALLHHDDGSEDVKAKCQTEMSNFLTEGRTCPFASSYTALLLIR